jgi:hypothetical protein
MTSFDFKLRYNHVEDAAACPTFQLTRDQWNLLSELAAKNGAALSAQMPGRQTRLVVEAVRASLAGKKPVPVEVTRQEIRDREGRGPRSVANACKPIFATERTMSAKDKAHITKCLAFLDGAKSGVVADRVGAALEERY